ncbi:deoA [Mytilus coruscus]|uniref:DeoA n=1 Tax=Mytilus coruscus TaxID=42192 RepID=A0A6J8DXR7_MYTCO|nr:deoA [Mytilus coruscus]
MDSPIGNAIEVAEAIECRHDNGPDDIMDLVYSLGAQVLHQNCKTLSTQEARHQMIDIISSGAALRKFRDMIIAQGVSEPIADSLCKPGADMFKILPKAQNVTVIICKKEGQTWLKIHHDAPLQRELIADIDSIISVIPPDEVVINESRISDFVS